MKKGYVTNTFTGGLMMDLNPLIMKNSTLSNALNAALITNDGNENVLQCDMGNGRVETAYLPEGYVPLGTAELGGIIYIVSYNPLIDKCQIGSFPSPERNVSSDELGETNKSFSMKNFYSDITSALLKNPSQKIILRDDALNSGDKFIVSSSDVANVITGDNNYISAAVQTLTSPNADLYPKYLKLSVVSVQDDGKITEFNNSLTWYDYGTVLSNTDYSGIGYYIYPSSISDDSGNVSVDEYRNMVSSNYSVFQSKVSGKLAILAELEVINSFDVAWDAYKNDDGYWQFYFLLNWTYENDYAHDKINLYGIKIEQTDSDGGSTVLCDCDSEDSSGIIYTYPKDTSGETDSTDDTNDALTHQNTTFYSPVYIKGVSAYNQYDGNPYENNGGITTSRYNDGTDNQFFFDPSVTTTQTSGTITLTVIPAMPFGYLDYLKQLFEINLDLLGSGEMLLKQYKYYWESSNTTIQVGLETYPELNKEISGVSLQFYDYGNSDTQSYIEAYKDYLGSSDYHVEGSEWYQSSDDGYTLVATIEQELGSADVTEEISDKTSYSGTFTISAKDLNDDSLYLVAVSIYYDDTTITYFRFLYTTSIFNNYYSSVSDFIDIDLQDAIDTYYPITISATTSKTSTTTTEVLLDGETTSIVGYSEDADSYEYTIQDTVDVTATNKIVASNSVFGVNLSGCSYEVDPSVDYQSEKSTQLRTSSSNELDINDVSGTDSYTIASSDDSSLVVWYTISTAIPLIVDLSYSDSVSVEYELVQLNVCKRFLSVYLDERCIGLGISNYVVSDKDEYDCDSDGDKSKWQGSLKIKYPTTYSSLDGLLSQYDAVALTARMTTGSYFKDGIQFYVFDSDGSTIAKWELAPNKKVTDYYIPVLAVRDSDSQNVILLVQMLYDVDDDWYEDDRIKYDEVDSKATKPWFVVADQSDTDNPDPLPYLDYYYKLEDSAESYECYSYNSISYYDSCTVTLSQNISINATVTLYLDGSGSIKSYDEIPNLHYDTAIEQTLSQPIEIQLDYSQYIESIISPTTDNMVLLPNGNVVAQELSPKAVYAYNPDTNEVTQKSYFKCPTGITSSEQKNVLSNINNSLVGLTVVDGLLQVNMKQYKKYRFRFRNENGQQKITITDIYSMQ